jgi:adenylate cyclase
MGPAGQARVERRLAAILAADVAGYSRLIGADEEGTLNRLRSIRGEIVDPSIAQHRGRLVKTTGDGFLVEFASVIDALRCATEWQGSDANAKFNAAGSRQMGVTRSHTATRLRCPSLPCLIGRFHVG